MIVSTFQGSVPVRHEHYFALSMHCNMHIKLFHRNMVGEYAFTIMADVYMMCGHAYGDGIVKFQAWG